MHAELLPTKCMPRTREIDGDMREQRQRQLSFIVEMKIFLGFNI